MIIKQVTKGKNSQYQIYKGSDREQPLATFLSGKIGELVGYADESILCLNKGRFHVFNCQGERINSFYRFINPYPVNIFIEIAKAKIRITAASEEEEILYRKVAKKVKETPGETISDKIEVLMSHLVEKQIKCKEAELYMHCNKNISSFLEKELSDPNSLFSEEKKIYSLAFRISTLLITFDHH